MDGRTICGTGTWEGWYFSEELKEVINKYNYKIEVLKGYLFKKEVLFVNFVNTLYKIKRNSIKNDPKYTISKLLLNILYGRFRISPFIETIEIVKSKEAYKYYEKYDITEVVEFNNDIELLKFFKNNDLLDDNINGPNISIPIASAVVLYARIEINKYKYLPGYTVYYSDTDSVVLDKLLSQELVGKELGQIKLEYEIISGVFLIAKGYGILTTDFKEPIVVKIKGLKNPISYFSLLSLLYKQNKIDEYQEKWYRDWTQGLINVQNEINTLVVTTNKRLLIYDCCQKLIDTKPFILENGKIINKNIINILYYLPKPKELYCLPAPNKLYCLLAPNKLYYLTTPNKLLCLSVPVKLLTGPNQLKLLTAFNKLKLLTASNQLKLLIIPKQFTLSIINQLYLPSPNQNELFNIDLLLILRIIYIEIQNICIILKTLLKSSFQKDILKFLTFDIETYRDNENYFIPYACG